MAAHAGYETKERAMARIKRIDHVAIAVKDADQATRQFVMLLNAIPIRTIILKEKAGPAKVSYIRIGENVISLVQSMDADGFINQHIARHGEGLHHLGLEVDNLEEFITEVEGKGFKIPLRDEFSNRSELVLRPRDAAGVVLQIMEWKEGSDVTPEDRIKRILDLENLDGD
jgi:catechol 2,3-dioxygenase-like lactoylglutathione lyase family enzyme